MIAALLKRARHQYARWTHGGATCAEVEGFLVDYVEGTLEPDKRRLFEAHLRACPVCVAYLTDYRSAMSLAKRAAAEPQGLADAPSELVEAVLKTLNRPR